MAPKVLWILGAADKKQTGIGLYSGLIIAELRRAGWVVDEVSIPFVSRSIRRYFYQFLVMPWMIMFKARRYSCVVVYEEAFGFLAPFIKVGGSQAILILHHLATRLRAQTPVEIAKNIYLDANLWFARMAHRIVFPTQFSRSQFTERFPAFPSDRLRVVANAFEAIEVASNAPAGRITEGRKVVVYVGSEESRKNLITAVRGLAGVRARSCFHFVKVGRAVVAKNRHELIEALRDAGISHEIHDYLGPSELDDVLRSADIFIAPSVLEGFGRTPVEAQMRGTLVLASDIPVFREVLGDGAIFVGDTESEESWRRAFEELPDDVAAAGIARAGQRNALRFQASVVATEFASVLRSVDG